MTFKKRKKKGKKAVHEGGACGEESTEEKVGMKRPFKQEKEKGKNKSFQEKRVLCPSGQEKKGE